MVRGERGCLITIEGIEGVGKSTNLAFVADWLRASGRKVVVTREPGGTPAGERIRALLLASDGPPFPAVAELLLMFAARAAHMAQLISPALARGEWVVCDRFTDASFAYQGAGRGLPDALIRELEVAVQGDCRPDLTLLLDAGWEATRMRRRERGVADRFELEDAAFFERVRGGYLQRARDEPRRIRVIDAGRPLEVVRANLELELHAFVKRLETDTSSE